MAPLEAEVTVFVRTFEHMNVHQLRDIWRERYGAPPKLRSPELLRHLLAWRVQTDALGGLERRVVREIITAARGKAKRKAPAPQGSRISREYQGRVYEVEVVDGGFLHQGHRYKSLSAVALAITGTQWNGPRFFGLRDTEKAA